MSADASPRVIPRANTAASERRGSQQPMPRRRGSLAGRAASSTEMPDYHSKQPGDFSGADVALLRPHQGEPRLLEGPMHLAYRHDSGLASLYTRLSSTADRNSDLKDRLTRIEGRVTTLELQIQILRHPDALLEVAQPLPAQAPVAAAAIVERNEIPSQRRSCRCVKATAIICSLVAIPVLLYFYTPIKNHITGVEVNGNSPPTDWLQYIRWLKNYFHPQSNATDGIPLTG